MKKKKFSLKTKMFSSVSPSTNRTSLKSDVVDVIELIAFCLLLSFSLSLSLESPALYLHIAASKAKISVWMKNFFQQQKCNYSESFQLTVRLFVMFH